MCLLFIFFTSVLFIFEYLLSCFQRKTLFRKLQIKTRYTQKKHAKCTKN